MCCGVKLLSVNTLLRYGQEEERERLTSALYIEVPL